MPVPGRALTMQDVFAQLANNASESIPLTSSEVLNQLLAANEGLLVNVSGSPATYTTSTVYPVNVSGDYPIAYWRLAEPAATGVAYDSNQNLFSIYPRVSSSSVSTVTQGAASFYTAGASVNFTAAGSAVTFPNNSSLQITNDLSVEFWVNFTSLGTASTTYSIFSKGLTTAGGTGEFEIYMFNNAGTGQILYLQNNTGAHITGGALSAGTWYHVVAVRNSSANTTTIYVNASPVASGAYVAASTTTGNVVMGAAGSYSSTTMRLAEAAVYRKALTSAQVSSHRNWGTASDVTAAPYDGLAALYGEVPYPAYGTPNFSFYGNTTWGAGQWQ